MDNSVSLQALIKEGRQLAGQLVFHNDAFLPYYDFANRGEYDCWLSKTLRFLNANYLGDKDVERFETLAAKTITPSQQSKLVSILEAFAAIPVLVKEEKSTAQSPISIVNTQNQSQSQSADVCVLVFREAIKDEILGKDYKEISSILNDSSIDEQKKKDKIVEKMKSLGEGVLSNIVANIITNPAVITSFF